MVAIIGEVDSSITPEQWSGTSDTSVVKQPVIPSNIAAIAATAKNSFFIIVFVYLVDYILTASLNDRFTVRPLR